MNASKADILNPESENTSVKLALAETHVIQETKTFLEQHGVNLFSPDAEPGQRRSSRSDRIITVKNMYHTEPLPRTCARYLSRTVSSAVCSCRPPEGRRHKSTSARSGTGPCAFGACAATSSVRIMTRPPPPPPCLQPLYTRDFKGQKNRCVFSFFVPCASPTPSSSPSNRPRTRSDARPIVPRLKSEPSRLLNCLSEVRSSVCKHAPSISVYLSPFCVPDPRRAGR